MLHLGGVWHGQWGQTGVGTHGTRALFPTAPDVTNAAPQSLLLPPCNLHLELCMWTPKDICFGLPGEQ